MRTTRVLAFVLVGFGILAGVHSALVKADPVLTDKQKIAVRKAQVDLLVAQQQLQQSQQYKDMQSAQAKLNEVLQGVMDDLKIKPSDYELDNDLNLKALHPPQAQPSPPAKK